MIDFVVGGVLVALVIRGWLRGLLRQALDVAVLVVGVFLAFRLSTPAGALVSAMAGLSPEVSRLVGGIGVFLIVSVGAAVVGHLLHRGVAALPGLSTLNRLGGAAFAALWGLALTTLVVTVLAIVPVPPAVAGSLEDSSLADALTDPEGAPQQAIGVVGGDRVMRTLLRLEELVGKPRIIDDDAAPVHLPPAGSNDLERRARLAEVLFSDLNRERVTAGVAPLAWSDALATLAADHAEDMYLTGNFAHVASAAGALDDRLERAGLPFVVAGENLILGATVEGVHQAMLDSPAQIAKATDARFRKVGIAIVEGPLGLMTVQIYSG